MAKKAKLVSFILTTRVVVDEDATNEEIIKAALPKINEKILNNELPENLESIVDDTEIPYNAEFDEN